MKYTASALQSEKIALVGAIGLVHRRSEAILNSSSHRASQRVPCSYCKSKLSQPASELFSNIRETAWVSSQDVGVRPDDLCRDLICRQATLYMLLTQDAERADRASRPHLIPAIPDSDSAVAQTKTMHLHHSPNAYRLKQPVLKRRAANRQRLTTAATCFVAPKLSPIDALRNRIGTCIL
jgi:hypothetical protein